MAWNLSMGPLTFCRTRSEPICWDFLRTIDNIAPFFSSAKCTRTMAMLNTVIWSLGSESIEKDGILSLSVWRMLMSVISFVKGVFRIAARTRARRCLTCYFMDYWGDIMHRGSENGDLLVCCLIDSLSCKVIVVWKSYLLVVSGSTSCDGSGDETKALISSFVCGILLSKILHHGFHHLYHGGNICSWHGSPCAGKIVSIHVWSFLALLSKSPNTTPIV